MKKTWSRKSRDTVPLKLSCLWTCLFYSMLQPLLLPGRFCSRCRHESVLLLVVSVLLQTVLPLIILSSYFGCLVFFPPNSIPFWASEWALPWNSEYPRNTLDFFGPKKVSIFRAHPFQCSSYWCCTPQNHYVPRHENNRYINSYNVFPFPSNKAQ